MAETELSLTEGARYLGVSRGKIWSLVKRRKLKARVDPLDERRKLIKKTDLDKLKEAPK